MDGRILERENTYSELVHKSKFLCFFFKAVLRQSASMTLKICGCTCI
jgi:hypothetical protein